MNKSKNFSGQPIIKQVLNFIDPKDVYRTAKKRNSDRYTNFCNNLNSCSTVISSLAPVIRYHLMTYIDLFKFLKNPEAKWEEITTKNRNQLSLFDP